MKTKIITNLWKYLSIIAAISFTIGGIASAEEAPPETPLWDAYVKTVAEEGEFEGDADALFAEAQALIEAEVDLDPAADAAFVSDVYPSTSGYGTFLVNNLWLLISAFLVFTMHLGFSTLESGLTQSKNTVNILFKNVFIIAAGLLTYYFFGFNTHYPGFEEGSLGIFSWGGMATVAEGTMIANQTELYAGYTWWTDFIFQAMFAATAATIVSGAVAERIKLTSFMIYTVLLVGVLYPIVGSWHWGSGFLQGGGFLSGLFEDGFYDFAGSTVVHAFGGFAALACVIILGPRAGKYSKDGGIKPILGSNMPLATIGVFLLWLGWFGFNGGSVLNADANLVSFVFVTTALAAAGGAVGAIIISWLFLKKPDLSMALNGILAGLVGITAGADAMSIPAAILVGLIAGVIVVFSIVALDKLKIDDPVGAISVHGTCGLWGTWAVGIFGDANLLVQVIGSLIVAGVAFGFSAIAFTLLKGTMGIRVDEETEAKGLDVEEHGAPAYAQTSTLKAAPEPAVATVEA
jgi:Amt family ammonium transporter